MLVPGRLCPLTVCVHTGIKCPCDGDVGAPSHSSRRLSGRYGIPLVCTDLEHSNSHSLKKLMCGERSGSSVCMQPCKPITTGSISVGVHVVMPNKVAAIHGDQNSNPQPFLFYAHQPASVTYAQTRCFSMQCDYDLDQKTRIANSIPRHRGWMRVPLPNWRQSTALR
jgi:hypothetical protein